MGSALTEAGAARGRRWGQCRQCLPKERARRGVSLPHCEPNEQPPDHQQHRPQVRAEQPPPIEGLEEVPVQPRRQTQVEAGAPAGATDQRQRQERHHLSQDRSLLRRKASGESSVRRYDKAYDADERRWGRAAVLRRSARWAELGTRHDLPFLMPFFALAQPVSACTMSTLGGI